MPELSDLWGETTICRQCLKDFSVIFESSRLNGVKVMTLYDYNETLKTTIYHLKGLKDIELAPLFLERYIPYLRAEYRDFVLVPAPSTAESDKERGFNHVVEIFKTLKRPFLHVVHKKEAFKQSDLSFEERQKVGLKLTIHEGHLLKGKKVLIVDDIKTSGATLKAIVHLITPFQPKKIEILVIARTKVNT